MLNARAPNSVHPTPRVAETKHPLDMICQQFNLPSPGQPQSLGSLPLLLDPQFGMSLLQPGGPPRRILFLTAASWRTSRRRRATQAPPVPIVSSRKPLIPPAVAAVAAVAAAVAAGCLTARGSKRTFLLTPLSLRPVGIPGRREQRHQSHQPRGHELAALAVAIAHRHRQRRRRHCTECTFNQLPFGGKLTVAASRLLAMCDCSIDAWQMAVQPGLSS